MLAIAMLLAASSMVLASVSPGRGDRGVCDVRSFGAKGDGEHLDTLAIQQAVHSCAGGGGGTVYFGPGTYLSGSIQLSSNITLEVGASARLLGSGDVKQYVPVGRSSEDRSTALIWAVDARNISIVGAGVIDGNGRAFMDRVNPHATGAYDGKATRQGAEAFLRFSQNREGPVRMLPRPGVLVLLIECENV